MKDAASKSALFLRPATAADRSAVIDLVDGVYREYGDQICLDGADGDLRGVPEHYTKAGGAFVVLTDGREIVGTHAALPLDEAKRICTFRRLYLDAGLRGTGWGRFLMQWAIDWAQSREQRRVEFWSDVRFTRAHPFFESLGFQRDGRVRDMDDGAMPYQEHFFFLDLPS